MTGFICVNKAQGVSSAREVNIIKRLTDTPCGHMGTLDPMASGVLPVAVGNACRLFDYFLSKRKVYEATFAFGLDTDTLDTTGEVLLSGGAVPSEEEISAVIPRLIGEVEQVPPRYSAKCVGGKRGYQLAREGVDFILPSKRVHIGSIVPAGRVSPNEYKFIIECGGGTYIRSIARDMAALLGTHAVMSALVRTRSGIFTLDNSVKTENLTPENVTDHLVLTEEILPFSGVYPQGNDAKKLFNGLAVRCNLQDGTYKIYTPASEFYGLAAVENGWLKIRTKLC